MKNKTLVMKFGGAAFATPKHFFHIAQLIAARLSEYQKLIIVVSAMGSTTDQLIELAHQVNQKPPQREYDMLISAGERISMSLLAMALDHLNISAQSFTGSQSGIVTNCVHGQAQIIDVRPHRLIEALNSGKVVIVAGFQGVSEKKEVTTLGRGGSDTSAVALGLALNAEKVEFYKDVEGIYPVDPKVDSSHKPFEQLSYADSLSIVNRGAKVLHARAIELAAKNALPLHVRSFSPDKIHAVGTFITDDLRVRRRLPIYEESTLPETSVVAVLQELHA